MINLDRFDKILSIDRDKRIVVMQSGIRLRDLGLQIKEHGLAMPNLGSIDEQSIAGAIATATHGSSLRHGILSQDVLALKIALSNSRVVSCSPSHNTDLFRAALVSLGALGIITEVTFIATPSFNIEWHQSLQPISSILDSWNHTLWTDHEFTRVWWMPYMRRAVKWTADKTSKPTRPVPTPYFRGSLGFHSYHLLLYLAQFLPSLLPLIERFVIFVQYGTTTGAASSGISEGRTGLLMNCLYSQFVNEWALPLHKGPEAISRLEAWLHGDPHHTSGIPFDPAGVYVHAPIEVRVSDSSSSSSPRPFLDNTVPDGPTLYLNATLYRPYNRDPPCHERYYEAFEWLMKEMGGRPHWAKSFRNVDAGEFGRMYPQMGEWLRVRGEVDPEGMFVGPWQRRFLLGRGHGELGLEEKEVGVVERKGGGVDWIGEMGTGVNEKSGNGNGDGDGKVEGGNNSPKGSEESFDLMAGVEAERSVLLEHHDSTE